MHEAPINLHSNCFKLLGEGFCSPGKSLPCCWVSVEPEVIGGDFLGDGDGDGDGDDDDDDADEGVVRFFICNISSKAPAIILIDPPCLDRMDSIAARTLLVMYLL